MEQTVVIWACLVRPSFCDLKSFSKEWQRIWISGWYGAKKYNNGMPLNRNDVVELLRRRLEISIVKPRYGAPVNLTDNVPFRICCYSDNPEEAAKIANAVVDGYRAFWQEEHRQVNAVPIERRVTVLDPAVPAYRPVRPNRPLNLILGAFAGVLIGVVVAPLLLGLVACIGNRRSPPAIPQRA